MDSILKRALNTTKLCPTGFKREGTISQGEAYKTDFGDVFVKCSDNPQAQLLYDGEFAGLSAIAATNTVVVPKPITVLDNPDGGACLVTELLEMSGVLLNYSAELGENIARLHLHESIVGVESSGAVHNFGFHKTTFHCKIPQDNTWKSDWPTFFVENRLEPQFRILEKKKNDMEAIELWPRLKDVIPTFFEDVEIKPSLLHGDLWGGNAAETLTHPVAFDLASVFYGHHEYDIAVSKLWGGFTSRFYDAYHTIIPKASGFDKRKKLYQLFQLLHNWNYSNDCFRGVVIATMKALLK